MKGNYAFLNIIQKCFNSFFVRLLMSIVPTTWFVFYSAFSNNTNIFVDENGNLASWTVVVNLIMILMMFSFSVGVLIENIVQNERAIKEQKIYSSIISNVNAGYQIIRNKQIENINVTNESVLESDYRSAIYTVMGNLLTCLCEISQVEREKYVITYFYNISGSSNWSTISSDEGYKGLSKTFLIQNKSTVISQILDNNEAIFYSSKEKAIEKNKYVPDNRDKQQLEYNCPMGSIFGANWKLSDHSGNCIFENAITIGTYGKEICKEKDVAAKRAIVENVLNVFRHQFTQIAFAYNIIK